MKQYFLGSCLAVITFCIGFVSAPIRFVAMGSGHGSTADFEHPCYFIPYESNYFERVVLWSCSYNSESQATDSWVSEGEKYRIVSATEGRYVASYSIENKTYYCVLRVDGKRVTDLCSPSLRHIFALEEQRSSEGLFKDH